MAITAISRDWGVDPSIVRITDDANLSTITTSGYVTTQEANIEAIQNGAFQWLPGDYILIYYSNGEGFFTYDSSTGSFVAAPSAPGSLSNTLANTHIFVGNASNVATGVAMSGDATIANTGALTIANNAVTGAKMANNTVTSTQLALNTIQYARVPLSNANFLGMYATPVSIIAAAGANTAIVIQRMVLETVYGTTQSAAGGAVALQYGNAAHGAGALATATIAAATLNGDTASTLNMAAGAAADVLLSAAANTAVYISNQTGAFTTGDSTYFVHVWYEVVATN